MRRAWAAVDMGQAKGTACQGRGSLSEGPACHPSSRDGVRKIPCYTALRLAWATGNPVLKREQSKEKQTFRLSKSPSQEEGQHQPINRRESSSTGKLRHRTSPPSSSSLKQNTPPQSAHTGSRFPGRAGWSVVWSLEAVGSDPESEQRRCEAGGGCGGGGILPTRRGPVALGPAWLEIRRPHSLKKQKAQPACLFICLKYTLWFFFLFFFFNR